MNVTFRAVGASSFVRICVLGIANDIQREGRTSKGRIIA